MARLEEITVGANVSGVEVESDATHTVYLKRPFRESPYFVATSVNYNIVELVNGAEISLRRG